MVHLTRGKIGVALAVMLAASFGSPAAAQAPPLGGKKADKKAEPQHLVVTDQRGAKLGPDPTLRSGAPIYVTVRGFAPRAPVEVRLVSRPSLPYRPRADRDGILRFLYQVPADLSPGAHRLTFSGAGPTATPPGRSRAAGTVEIVVTVPNIAVIPFTVKGHVHG